MASDEGLTITESLYGFGIEEAWYQRVAFVLNRVSSTLDDLNTSVTDLTARVVTLESQMVNVEANAQVHTYGGVFGENKTGSVTSTPRKITEMDTVSLADPVNMTQDAVNSEVVIGSFPVDIVMLSFEITFEAADKTDYTFYAYVNGVQQGTGATIALGNQQDKANAFFEFPIENPVAGDAYSIWVAKVGGGSSSFDVQIAELFIRSIGSATGWI